MDHKAHSGGWGLRLAAMTALVGLATLAGCGKHDFKLLGPSVDTQNRPKVDT